MLRISFEFNADFSVRKIIGATFEPNSPANKNSTSSGRAIAHPEKVPLEWGRLIN
jgi:hypothetical protein